MLCAAIAYENFKNGKQNFYDFNEYKAETVTEPVTAEATTQASETVSEEAPETETTDYITAVTEIKTAETAQMQAEERDFTPLIVAAVVLIMAVCLFFLFKSKGKTAFAITVVVISAAVIAFALNLFFSDRNNASVGTVTVSIRCDTVKDSGEKHIPSDGIILKETEVEISKGDTVYDVLAAVCKENGILFSANMGYIEGINNLYETDFGDSSGWVYFVNGESPSVGCGSYELSDGDEIKWCYTRNLRNAFAE